MNATPSLTPIPKRHGVPRSTVRLIHESFGTECELQRSMIAEAAYYLAKRRGFAPGHELDDWLAAEGEIKQLWARAREEALLPCCTD
jgi:Protein of unknown function (DUF2934)